MALATVSFQQIAVLSSAQALTVPAGARAADVQAEGQVVRYRLDGTSPTTAIGQRLIVTDKPTRITLEGGLLNAKFIEETAGAKLNVHYYS
jgi:hypothetical protein